MVFSPGPNFRLKFSLNIGFKVLFLTFDLKRCFPRLILTYGSEKPSASIAFKLLQLTSSIITTPLRSDCWDFFAVDYFKTTDFMLKHSWPFLTPQTAIEFKTTVGALAELPKPGSIGDLMRSNRKPDRTKFSILLRILKLLVKGLIFANFHISKFKPRRANKIITSDKIMVVYCSWVVSFWWNK